MAPDKPLHALGMAEAARLIASRAITSEALVSACLARVAEREGQVKAWSFIDPELALQQARACDASAVEGALHGVPIGVKDVLDTFDMPTEMGSPIYAGYRPAQDAACVALARMAGAVVMGKTVTCEFAGMAPGATTNPHDPARTPGGSSSGSGAAVADFMAPLAFGTQTGGSVLRPAAFCGVIGYKPTFGTFNRAGMKFAAESIDTIGLIAREIEDMALMSSVLTGAPFLAPAAPERPLRIGLCRTYLWDKADASARAALQRAADAAREAGADVVDYEMPAHFSALTPTREVFNNVERARSLPYEWTHHRGSISPVLSRSIEAGFATSQSDYIEAKRFAERCRIDADSIFDRCDVLLTPAANGEAPVGLHYAGDPSFQGLWTLLHTPTIAIPAGRGVSGMPVSVQLIARRYDDKKLLDAAHWLIARAGVAATMA